MDVRRLASIGLALAAIGLVVPGFHHIRCTAVPEGSTSGSPCVETFPVALVPIAAFGGLVGACLALYGAFRLAREERDAAARVVLGLAALALVVPTALPIASWAWVGFDVGVASPGEGCTSVASITDLPLWLQHATCLRWPDLVMTPLVFAAGAIAAFGARNASRGLTLAALIVAGAALATFVFALVRDEVYLGETWIVPLAGAVLLAGALGLLVRAQAPAQST